MPQHSDEFGVPVVRVDDHAGLAAALQDLELFCDRAVIVLVGGAGGMDKSAAQKLGDALRYAIVPAVVHHAATIVDGGTDSGVMRAAGVARAESRTGFPLLGVAAAGTVIIPDGPPPSADAAPLEPHHSHFLLVPGDSWGAEAPWIADVASVLAAGRPSITVLSNGGEIAYTDVSESLRHNRAVLVLSGTGRTADAIADARAGGGGGIAARRVAASPLTQIVDVGDVAGLRSAIDAVLR